MLKNISQTNLEAAFTKRLKLADNEVRVAVAALGRGEMIVVTDSSARENEGDIFVLAENVSPEQVNFMIHECCGLLCVAMNGAILDKLQIPLMLANMTTTTSTSSALEDMPAGDNKPLPLDLIGPTAFTISVDHKSNHTGISATERADTLRALAHRKSQAKDFIRPGHIFPLRAAPSIFMRPGHTEAAVTLAEMAEKRPVVAICEIINEDGSMARAKDLTTFAGKYNFCRVTIENILLICLYKNGWLTPLFQRSIPNALQGSPPLNQSLQVNFYDLSGFLPKPHGTSSPLSQDYGLLCLTACGLRDANHEEALKTSSTSISRPTPKDLHRETLALGEVFARSSEATVAWFADDTPQAGKMLIALIPLEEQERQRVFAILGKFCKETPSSNLNHTHANTSEDLHSMLDDLRTMLEDLHSIATLPAGGEVASLDQLPPEWNDGLAAMTMGLLTEVFTRSGHTAVCPLAEVNEGFLTALKRNGIPIVIDSKPL